MSLEKFRSASRSASSAKLLEVRIKVVRFGSEFASVGWMLLTLLRASRSVCSRGESGKLERAVMSLSVKSMASWSYSNYCSAAMFSVQFSYPWRRERDMGERRRARKGKQWKGKVREGGDQPLQRPDSRWRVFCVL